MDATLAGAPEDKETRSRPKTDALRICYEFGDGSYLAFFEARDMPFEFKPKHDYYLHIALEAGRRTLADMPAKGEAA